MITVSRTKRWEIPRMFLLYRNAFPRSERKPFPRITSMAKAGRADLWTIRMDGRFAGLAATVNGPDIVLLDYFAVKRSLRGRGVGSSALLQLERAYADRGFFVEIESTLEEADNREQRERRKGFYVNCGMVPMNTEADVFGVRMELLGCRCMLDFAAYKAFYVNFYTKLAEKHVNPVKEEAP